MSVNLYDVPSAANALPVKDAAAGIVVPICEPVIPANAVVVVTAPNIKTPAGASVISISIWPNIEVSMILVDPWKKPNQFLLLLALRRIGHFLL